MLNEDVVIDLITVVTEKDAIDQVVEKLRTTSTIFGKLKSIGQKEFYEAGRSGFQPDICVVVYDFEYHDEAIVRLDSKLYSVYRAYYVPGCDRVELYLEERGGTKDEPDPSDSGA